MRDLWRVIAPALWAPLLVFAAHVVLDGGLGVYDAYPWLDGPMHVCGGLAVAYVIATAMARLRAGASADRRQAVVEPVLVVTGTATVAVLWEFGEFAVDWAFGTTLQGGLPNTMKDLAMGLVGAVLVVASLRIIRGSGGFP